MKKKINFAIIGCGSVSIDHAKAINKLGHNIYLGSTKKKNSKNWRTFKKKFPSTKFGTIDEILENKKVDKIVSCLPINEQKKNFQKLLFCKKPILIEKPLHDNYKVLKKILGNKKINLNNKAIGYNRRNYKIINFVKKNIDLNKINHVDVNISENIQYLKKKYKSYFYKNFLHIGSSSHIIDLLFYIFGDLKIIKKWNKNFSVSIVSMTKKKFPIFIKINHTDSESPYIKIRFNNNYMWEISPLENLKIYRGNKIIKSTNNYFKRKYIPKIISTKNESNNMRPGFFLQMKNFAKGDFRYLCKPKENFKLIKFFNQII